MRSRQCLYAISAFLLLLAPQLGAQQITGRVTNAQTGEPLAAVQVFIAGSGIGALTQQNGRYLLLNVPAGTHTLTAERIGYRSATLQVTVTAGATSVQDFALNEEALGLDEIIVTGTPGGTQRRAIGNTVASVRVGEVRERAVVTNAQGLLRGRSPGLTMGVPSGSIGQGADITIRGVGSFNRDRSNPLIFVDGIRVNNSNDAGPQMGQGQRLGNVLDDFNPADIESIEIIKGPAAATLYGTEASAGVIQIITKRGQQGEPQFTASVAGGLNFTRVPHERMGTNWACTDTRQTPCVGRLDAVVPYNMVHLMNRALRDGTLNPEWNYDNWPQKNLFQYGPSHSLNVDVRGGTDRIRYFLSANHDRDEGPEFYNWNNALRMRANVGVILSDEFSLDISTGYVSGETSYSSQAGLRGGTWDQMVWGSGYCAPYVATVPNPCPRVLGFQQMIPTDIAKVTSIREYDRFTGSGTLSYTRGWLASRLIMGIDNGYDTNTWTHPIETVQAAVIQETQFGEVVLERPSNKDLSLDWSATVTVPVISTVSSATSVGAQYFSRVHQFFGNTGRGFASPLSRTINQTPVASMSVNYDFIQNKSLGFYVQEQLGWNDRLFVTGAVRFDDNSAFGSAFDPVMYPKVSAAWVISEEPFWNVGFVDELRLRGAWGQAGRQPDTFAGVNTFGIVAGPGGRSVLNPASTGNPDVGPEKSSELEVGFDIETLDGRVAGEFSWYKKVSQDNLLGIALPGSMGAGGARQENVGVIENWGWEALLNTRIYESSNIALAVDFSGAYKMNEITELGDYPGSGDIKLGLPYPSQTASTHWIVRAEYDNAGPIVDGYGRRIQAYCDKGILLDPDGGDPRESQYGTVLGGEIVPCQEIAGYSSIVGPAFSPYTWTVNPKLTLHGVLQIHAMIDGAFGGYGQDSQKQWHHTYNTAYGAVTHADPLYAAMHRLGANSGRALFKKEFWKLREAGVRYQMPESFTGRFGAERAALSLSAREIATLWSADPHAGLQPSARQLNFPPATLRDIEPGRAGEGDGGHRSYPPSTSLHLRLDVTF